MPSQPRRAHLARPFGRPAGAPAVRHRRKAAGRPFFADKLADFLPERPFLRAELNPREAEPVPRHGLPLLPHGPRIRDRPALLPSPVTPAPGLPDPHALEGGGAKPAVPGREPCAIRHDMSCFAVKAPALCHELSWSPCRRRSFAVRFLHIVSSVAFRSVRAAAGPAPSSGGTLFARVLRPRAPARAGAIRAGAVRAPDCARETADARLPSVPAGAFFGPSRILRRKAERRPRKPPL